MTTRAPVVLKKFDPRQKRKGLKAWSSRFLKETKLLEIPDPKIAFCQNLKRISLFPIMPSLSSAIILIISSYEINNGKGPTELHALKKQ